MRTSTEEAIVVEVRELKSGSEEKERGSEVALGAATLGEKWAAIVEARCGREKEFVFSFSEWATRSFRQRIQLATV
jgi:hypothetical protein